MGHFTINCDVLHDCVSMLPPGALELIFPDEGMCCSSFAQCNQ